MTAPRRRDAATHPPGLHVRPERPDDAEAIAEITREAFRTDPRSTHNEEFIIAGLRAAGALAVSLVAESGDRVIGHIAFSPVEVSDGTTGWFGLGPMAVATAQQQSGAGSMLIVQGLSVLNERGAGGCVVLGEPRFYGRFGFAKRRTLRLPGVPPEYFLVRSFSHQFPVGTVTYHAVFETVA